MSDMRLVVAGALGRMGRQLITRIVAQEGVVLAAALERSSHPDLGRDVGELLGLGTLGVQLSDDPLAAFVQADGVLDFTSPAYTLELAALAAQARIVHVIGTTGFEEAEPHALVAAARHAIIIKSGNMSLGVNLLAAMVTKVARALGTDYDIEIVEMHHNRKVDAPSGTALLLGEAAAKGRGIVLSERSDRGRDGITGARREGDIGFASLRGGSVVGDHTVMFAGPMERLELTHRADDRALFARGALHAALWGRGRKAGLYSMMDVLGLGD
jgi:4-hydroxy-tetrahydrodipicolinate reductase